MLGGDMTGVWQGTRCLGALAGRRGERTKSPDNLQTETLMTSTSAMGRCCRRA